MEIKSRNNLITNQTIVLQEINGKVPVPYTISELRLGNINVLNSKTSELYRNINESERIYQNTNENLDLVAIEKNNSIAKKCFENAGIINKFVSSTKEIWKDCDYLYNVSKVKKYKDILLSVSNFGRIKIISNNQGEILKQQDIEPGKGCLYVPNFWKKLMVWTLVAHTWLEKDKTQDESLGNWHVHHISNNGYDNRPENLIWLRETIHFNYVHK